MVLSIFPWNSRCHIVIVIVDKVSGRQAYRESLYNVQCTLHVYKTQSNESRDFQARRPWPTSFFFLETCIAWNWFILLFCKWTMGQWAHDYALSSKHFPVTIIILTNRNSVFPFNGFIIRICFGCSLSFISTKQFSGSFRCNICCVVVIIVSTFVRFCEIQMMLWVRCTVYTLQLYASWHPNNWNGRDHRTIENTNGHDRVVKLCVCFFKWKIN